MNRQGFDAAYLQRLAEGDSQTERHFFAYFGELVLAKTRFRHLDPALGEDVRQETLLRVLRTLRSPGGLRCAEALGAFVNGVCNNVLKEGFRERKRHEPPAEEREVQADTATPSPETQLITRERQQAVRRVIEAMSPEKARLLREIVLAERDRDEVCREFQVSPDYLRVLLHRAKQEFREIYLDRESPPSAQETAFKAKGVLPAQRGSRDEMLPTRRVGL